VIGAHRLVSFPVLVVVGVIVYIAYLIVCVVVSWKEIRKFRGLRQKQKALGLSPDKYISFVGREEFKFRIVRILPASILTLMGMAMMMIAIVYENPWLSDIGVLVMAVPSALVARFALGRNILLFENRLKSSQKLLDILIAERDANRDKETIIQIANEQYKEISRIERAVVSLDRQRAMRENRKRPGQALPIQQSRTVLNGKAELAPFVRTRVQTAIEELSHDAHPAASIQQPDGNWLLPVPDTSLGILYTISEKPPRVLIQNLLPTGPSNNLEAVRGS
jgi:hypothetical protein